MTYPDNGRYASRYAYRAERLDADHEGCRHPTDLHYRFGCAAEDCVCSYVPPAMNLVEAVRILNASRSEGWLR